MRLKTERRILSQNFCSRASGFAMCFFPENFEGGFVEGCFAPCGNMVIYNFLFVSWNSEQILRNEPENKGRPFTKSRAVFCG